MNKLFTKICKVMLRTIGNALPNYGEPFGSFGNAFRCMCVKVIVGGGGILVKTFI